MAAAPLGIVCNAHCGTAVPALEDRMIPTARTVAICEWARTWDNQESTASGHFVAVGAAMAVFSGINWVMVKWQNTPGGTGAIYNFGT